MGNYEKMLAQEKWEKKKIVHKYNTRESKQAPLLNMNGVKINLPEGDVGKNSCK